MIFKDSENLETWFLKRKPKDFPNGIDQVTRYIHIRDVIVQKIQKSVMVGATIKEMQQPEGKRRTMTGHDPDHFKKVVDLATKILNTGKKDWELTPYEVFFLLVAIHVHDIGNILGRDNHENTLYVVFNDLFLKDVSIDSVEKKIYLDIASAHSGLISESKDKIRLKFEEPIVHHNDREIRVRLLASVLRFADELTDTPERSLSYIYYKGLGEKGSEIYHEYAKSLRSTVIKHTTKSIDINYTFTASQAKKKFGKGAKFVYLLDEIYERILKLHYEKIYCQRFFSNFISIEHVNVRIDVISDDHTQDIKKIKIRLTEHGYPELGKKTILDICENPSSLQLEGSKFLNGQSLKKLLKRQ